VLNGIGGVNSGGQRTGHCLSILEGVYQRLVTGHRVETVFLYMGYA
jgi:hypothetical protein